MSVEFKSAGIPIIRIGDLLLVPIQTLPSDAQARLLLDEVLHTLVRTGLSKLVLDVSALDMIDSYLTRIFYDITNAARTQGARAAIVGIRPAVAMTLVQMGIVTFEVETFLNLDDAMKALSKAA